MPSRAYASFLLRPTGVLLYKSLSRVNALSGLYLISTFDVFCDWERFEECVNALSGLYLISTLEWCAPEDHDDGRVNALSGLYLISTVSL